jgi:hypothetical protein
VLNTHRCRAYSAIDSKTKIRFNPKSIQGSSKKSISVHLHHPESIRPQENQRTEEATNPKTNRDRLNALATSRQELGNEDFENTRGTGMRIDGGFHAFIGDRFLGAKTRSLFLSQESGTKSAEYTNVIQSIYFLIT